MVSNPAGTESWNILKSEIDSVINRYIPMKKQRKLFKKKHLSKEALKRLDINKKCGGFINIRERIQIMKFSKRP